MNGFIARLGIFLLAIISFSIALIYGGAAWAPLPEGIPDSGQATSWTLQFAILAHVILGLRVLGLLVTWTFIAPTSDTTISRKGRSAVLHASSIAALWSLSAVIAGLTTMANVLGVPFREVFRQGFISTYLMALPPSRSYMFTALIALAITFAGIFLVSLNSIALLAALAGAGIAAPLLNSHASSLGSHSLAITSSVAHGLAMSTWVGCLWAVSSFVKAKDLKVVARFSALAATSVAVLAISGLAAAYARLDSVSDLWLSRYGQIVVVKIVFFAILMILAIQIRARLTSTGSLTKFLGTEVAIMATAIGVGVALHSTPMSRISAPLNSAGEEILGFAYPPSPSLSSIIFGWNPEWFMLTISLVAAALYTFGVIRIKQNQIQWSTLRTISFMVGVGLVIWTTNAGISMYSKVSFEYHMIQHMTLSMIAPIFIVIGTPITLALRALPAQKTTDHRSIREWILALLHSGYSNLITHPLIVLAIFTFGLYGLYFTPLFATLMASHTGHIFMELHFLISGLLFSYVVVGSDPSPRNVPYWARLMIVLVGLSLHAFFAIAIMQSGEPIGADWYIQVQPPWLPNLLADTTAGGSIAWALGEIPTFSLLVIVAVMWSRDDTRLAKQLDRAADRDGDADLKAYNAQLGVLNHRENSPNE
jgi:cytochrome c oxidase assembly factor CtaG